MRTRVLVVPHHPAWRGAAAERDVRPDARARPDELVLRVLTCAGRRPLPPNGPALDPQQRVREHQKQRRHGAGSLGGGRVVAGSSVRRHAARRGMGESSCGLSVCVQYSEYC